MSNDMVERVAKAIALAEGANMAGIGVYIKVAKAAIEAMREPTKAMLHAGAVHSIVTDVCWKVMIEAALKDG